MSTNEGVFVRVSFAAEVHPVERSRSWRNVSVEQRSHEPADLITPVMPRDHHDSVGGVFLHRSSRLTATEFRTRKRYNEFFETIAFLWLPLPTL